MVLLWIKMLRNIWAHKSAYAACIFLIGMGTLMMVSMRTAVTRLTEGQALYYQEYRLADVFATVEAIPDSAKASLTRIEGVTDVTLRQACEVRLILPEQAKIMFMRLISIPEGALDSRNERPLNALYTQEASRLSQGDNSILVDPDFLDLHSLNLGDTIPILVQGQEKELLIGGTAGSPEYIYTVRSGNEILPDPEAFSVAYMPEASLMRLSGNQFYNDVSLTLAHDVRFEDIRPLLEDALSPYGLYVLYDRDDLLSHAMLEMELESLGAMSTSIPALFILIAVLMLGLTLKRLIEQERGQIGVMKALGYSTSSILFHYMQYGLVTGLFGSLLGSLGGIYLADRLTYVLTQFFKLPYEMTGPVLGYVLVALCIGTGGGLLGACFGAWQIVQMQPAEALRSETPKIIPKNHLQWLPSLKQRLSTTTIMAIRGIGRNKGRAFVITLGITFSYGLLAFMGSYNDMIDKLLMEQYTKIKTYDMKITFATPVHPSQAINDILHIDGVVLAEGSLSLPVQLKSGHLMTDTILTGLPTDGVLQRIYDNETERYLLPSANGVILTTMVADKLGIDRGDMLMASTPHTNEAVAVPVVDIITVGLGEGAYMELYELCNMLYLPPGVNDVLIRVSNPEAVQDSVKEGSNVVFIEDRATTLNNYQLFLAPYDTVILIMEIMAAAVAFAVIASISAITLSERKREYATLRVLGMQSEEVRGILTAEYGLLLLAALLLGHPFTRLLKYAIATVMDSDLFTFPQSTPIAAHMIATVGCVAAVWVAIHFVGRAIDRFDLVESLKEREL